MTVNRIISIAKIAIIAGNGAEAAHAARLRGLRNREWFYVSRSERLTGAFGLTVIRTGSYRKRKDIAAIRRMLSGCELATGADISSHDH
jgi:hypothetical protein